MAKSAASRYTVSGPRVDPAKERATTLGEAISYAQTLACRADWGGDETWYVCEYDDVVATITIEDNGVSTRTR